MPGEVSGYDPIDDWSADARRRLVAARGDEIRELLDLAFSAFVDAEPGTSLAAFGFRGEDPVADAVDWAIDRFASADLDAARIHAGSRSFRIFTEVRFWLSQKVGRRGFDRLMASARMPVARSEPMAAEATDSEDGDAACAFAGELAGELPAFRARTCADLVGFWLAGTKRMRRDWFGWRDDGDGPSAASRLSKKQRSVYAHDAMFRFLCCFHRLAPVSPATDAELSFHLTSLSGCPNEPPYRVADRTLVHRGLGAPRRIAHLRKDGARALLHRCIDLARAERVGSARDVLATALTRGSLGRTTLHALDLEDDQALRRAIDEVCEAGGEASP